MRTNSTYPPKFSSDITYENRYDLDEMDVFLEGDGKNSMYFSISGLPKILGYGKYYFTISMKNAQNQPYILQNGVDIYFEFKSVNNIVIFSDVSDKNEVSGVSVCYVEVLTDPRRTFSGIEDGFGTLVIASTLEENSNFKLKKPIPPEWKNRINYKCIFPIEVRKTLSSANSPVINSQLHEKITFRGPFSFVGKPFSLSYSNNYAYLYNNDGSINSTTSADCVPPPGYGVCNAAAAAERPD